METEKLEITFDACRPVARSTRKETIKAQLVAAGRAKWAERDAKLSGTRAKKAAKLAEVERLKSLTQVVKWSALKALSNADLSDQLKVHKIIHGKKGFCVTGNRTTLVKSPEQGEVVFGGEEFLMLGSADRQTVN